MSTRYLVDNNALIALKRDFVASAFFRAHCQVTTDVLHEASEHPHLSQLKAGAYPLTPAVLENVRTVMASVEVGDIGLVDLYRNKGTADPGLIASALDAITADEDALFSDHWVIVTNDGAVEEAAARHGVATIKPDELAVLVDEMS
ncbi:hypothetical protein [Nocardioides sp. WS12]|uniref:hypothetical protein n=1 Tax=Nocardioides sp. WS12 TaxID=2486272 RepID=UPI0015F7A97E|nr:hypothetical protein [Nocardioides sp. WS12]